MTDRNMLIIKSTWSYVITQPDIAGEMFYEKLFELDPHLKPMFQSNMEHQIKKLMNMITFMVTNLQTMQETQMEIEALAKRHVQYGTHDEHYPCVGQALIWVLEHSLGERWNDETGKAWTDLYTMWASSMIQASACAQTENDESPFK